jgi:hypothetical protein
MPPTGDFDDVSKVLADLELALELGRSGDDYMLLLDGRAA